MKHLTRIIALLGISLISLFVTRPVLAFPPLPSSFYGTVKVNGANVADGTIIKALINGHVYAETQTFSYQGDSVYSLDIPGDDTTSTDVVEGGLDGETISFTIGGAAVAQKGIWKGGTNINLNLSSSMIGPQNTSTSPAGGTAQSVSLPTQTISSMKIQENAPVDSSSTIMVTVIVAAVAILVIILWQLRMHKPKA